MNYTQLYLNILTTTDHKTLSWSFGPHYINKKSLANQGFLTALNGGSSGN